MSLGCVVLMFASLEARVLRQDPTMSDVPTSTLVHYDIAEILCVTARAAQGELPERELWLGCKRTVRH